MTDPHQKWLADFARQWKDNADRSEANQLMDSGWSAATADRCRDRAYMLTRDLVTRLAMLQPPADNPELAALIAAAKIVCPPG